MNLPELHVILHEAIRRQIVVIDDQKNNELLYVRTGLYHHSPLFSDVGGHLRRSIQLPLAHLSAVLVLQSDLMVINVKTQ